MPDAKALFRAWLAALEIDRTAYQCDELHARITAKHRAQLDDEAMVMRLLCELTERFARMGWPR